MHLNQKLLVCYLDLLSCCVTPSPCSSFPADSEIVELNCETICLHSSYSQQTVQGCLLETLEYFYHILTNGEDADFTLKDIGTLTIRAEQVEMTFCEDFLLHLNTSTYLVQKLLNVSVLVFSCTSYSGFEILYKAREPSSAASRELPGHWS